MPCRIAPDRPRRQRSFTVPRWTVAARPCRDRGRADVVAVPLDPPAPSASPPPPPAVSPPPSEPARASGTQQIRREVARGLRYAHFRANANTTHLIRLISTVEAATGMLEEQGLLDRSLMEKRKAAAAERVGSDLAAEGLGVQLDPSTVSKYEPSAIVRIDCENRIALCHAACCKLSFALSREDVQEGTIRWDFGNPYVIARGEDGWCVHLDRGRKTCGAYSARPRTCRTYDCRKDARIWLDFEKRIVNPEILEPTWPRTDPFRPPPEAGPGTPETGARAASGRPPILDRLASRPQIWSTTRWYVSVFGVFLALGFATGLGVWLARAGSDDSSRVDWPFIGALVLSAYLGSRLLWSVEHGLERVFSGPKAASGRHSFYGGLLGALGFTTVWLNGQDGAWRIADIAAPSIALGYAIAKLGCFGSGCCVGVPATRGPTVRYFHWAAKAVAVHKLAGVPLAPLQLYEGAYALVMALVLLMLPTSWVGSGRVFGAFMVALTLGRALLLPFRYREADARASVLLTGVLHVLFVTAGILLLTHPLAIERIDVEPLPVWAVAGASSAVAGLVLALFGVHRQPSAVEKTNTTSS
jgi:prolipoprotein diacylglyceryltransferase/Fe-S-cluster containining protein